MFSRVGILRWRRDALSRDGAAFHIRALRTSDYELERAFIAGLSPESRYNRLLYTLRDASPEFVSRLITLDYRDNIAFAALTALAQEQFIGVARYARDSRSSAAEFAIVVADAWQGRGVGTQLMDVLFDYARLQGLTNLYGTILASNHRMIDLVRHLGFVLSPVPNDATLLLATRSTHNAPHAAS